MRRRATQPGVSSTADFLSLATKWMFDVIGANHPIRLGLTVMGAMGLQAVAKVMYSELPSQQWLEAIYHLPSYQVAGFVFVPLFGPLLLPRKGIPEPIRVELALIEDLLRRANLNKKEKQLVYLELLQGSFKKEHRFSIVDIDAIRKAREKGLEGRSLKG